MLQGCKLLSQSEVLDGQFRSITEHATDEQQKGTNWSHFMASKTLDHDSKTIADGSKRSIRKSFVDKEYGIFARDRLKTECFLRAAVK